MIHTKPKDPRQCCEAGIAEGIAVSRPMGRQSIFDNEDSAERSIAKESRGADRQEDVEHQDIYFSTY